MTEENSKKNSVPFPIAKVAVVLGVVFIAVFLFSFSSTNPLLVLNPTQNTDSSIIDGQIQVVDDKSNIGEEIEFDSDILDPADFPVREDFFREVYKPRRETYGLFAKAGKFLNKDEEGVKRYFGLESEAEIFEELPAIPQEFSETAYQLASGNYYAIGLLEEEYFKQPEFYWNFKSLGLRYWTQPDSRYWVTNGYGSYPSDQFDTIVKTERDEFVGVVFVYSGWGVQTYQGMSLDANPASKQFFDIEISPKNFLLEPAWPKFKKNWAYKIEIRGKAKQDTPPGTYKIGINVVSPPIELKEQWASAHKNVYFDALNAIKPSGNFIEFNITVN